MRASVVLLRQSVCLGAESVVEPHGKRPHFELQGPARGEPWTCLPEREVSHGLVWGQGDKQTTVKVYNSKVHLLRMIFIQ